MTDNQQPGHATNPADLRVHRQDDVTASARARTAVVDYDYADQFVMVTDLAEAWTAQQWARALLEDGAGVGGQLIWRVLLGLRLTRRRAPDQVAGWVIAGRGDTWIALSARSGLMDCSLVVEAEDGEVGLATFIRYERSLGRRIWLFAAPRHRSLAPTLLTPAQALLRDRA